MQQIRYNKKINPSAILIEDGKVILYVYDLENELCECNYTMDDFQRWAFNRKVEFLKYCWRDSSYNLSDQDIIDLEEFMDQINIEKFELITMEVKHK